MWPSHGCSDCIYVLYAARVHTPTLFLSKNGISFDETASNCVLQPCKLQCISSYPLQVAFHLGASRRSSPMRKTVSAFHCQQSASMSVPRQAAAVRLSLRAQMRAPARCARPCLQTSWSSGRTSRATGTGNTHANTTRNMPHCARV